MLYDGCMWKQIICHCCSGSRRARTDGETVTITLSLGFDFSDFILLDVFSLGEWVVLLFFICFLGCLFVIVEEEFVEFLMTRKIDCGRFQCSFILGSLFFLNA